MGQLVRARSSITSSADEGGGISQMLIFADYGDKGSYQICDFFL